MTFLGQGVKEMALATQPRSVRTGVAHRQATVLQGIITTELSSYCFF